jgi:60 kDa SS-A/Ro ribonucleoprotein
MSKFNETVVKEEILNHMGAKAYKQTPKEELAFAVLTTFVESSYYEAKDERLTRIQALVKKIAAKDPEFVAKLAIYARKEFNMRSVFPVLVGELSKYAKGDGLVRRTIAKGTTRVDDLTELASYLGPKNLSSAVKRGVSDALNKFGEYEMAKYKSESKGVSLIDLVNLTHPKTNNGNTAIALDKLMTGRLKNTDTWEAQMSAGKSARDTFSDLLNDNKLGYMALLRNLRNIVKTGDTDLINKAAAVIADPEKVRRSKQLPFRFLSASQALDGVEEGTSSLPFEKDLDGVSTLKAAVEKAITSSVQNIPLLSGRTMILSDNSGSMTGDGGGASAVSALSKRNTADIANLFAVLYWSRAENTMVGLFGDKLVTPKLNRSKGVLENFKIIQKESENTGRSTEEGAFIAFEKLIENKTIVDRIVVFSDCQLGRTCNFYDNRGRRADSFNKLFNKYREINPNVRVYTVDLKGYGNAMTQDEGMLKLTGWSEKIFDIMEKSEIEAGAMVKEIESIEL